MDIERYSNPPEWDRLAINESGEAEAPPCACGCGERAKGESKYATNRCRTRAWELAHPRLDLSGMSIEQLKRAERMIQEAIRAAKEGLVRGTVDARHPVKHEKDERPSCRPRLGPDAWAYLKALAADAGTTPSQMVEVLVMKSYHEKEKYNAWRRGR